MRTAVVLGLAVLVAAGLALGLRHQLTLSALQAHRDELVQWRERAPAAAALAYLTAYIAMAALAIPGALVMTLAGGAVFGLALGTALASFGSAIGATLALLASRFVFRGWVSRHFRNRLATIDRGLARNGWMYLASLRLVPVIPFFLVDLLFGLTAFPPLRFYAVSQAAMLPATVVYVNAGTQLERMQSPADVASPQVLGSLALLAVLPIGARAVVRWGRRA